ncbi:hypothetical protein [Rubinisphaera italica]|uniref:Tetratricopeptide repeat protein n=1 Tax=Rubinisphaera italica TaxID=2527969 RepID=A0A5C5XMB5_9PLAN|nr:hypothetical protein [Rubinisphaera italica]TWT64346.1 hypothetical protein Pan54_51080 [Rubinisphaera italica]
MTDSPEDQILEIAEKMGGQLTEESVGNVEKMLACLKAGQRADWSIAAHFLLGLHHSDQFFREGFPTSHTLTSDEQIATSKAINHFTTFLQASTRPCFFLRVGTEEIETLTLGQNWWAAFGVDMQTARFEATDPRIPLCGETPNDIDLIGVALDRLALAHYLSGSSKQAAETLVIALMSPSADWWWGERSGVDLVRLYGWIGWLFFDAHDFSNACAYLQRCFDELEEHSEEGTSPVTVVFIRLVEMYMYGGNDGVEWRHAFADAGNVDAYGDFMPSGTLDHGCDAFMLRLAISHAACGNYDQAMNAANVCVGFGQPLQDLQFEVYEDFQPVPFPEARLVRAALSLKLNQCDSLWNDLTECLKTEGVRSEAVALACLHELCVRSQSTPDGMTLHRLSDHLSSLSNDEKALLEQRCGVVLGELLDGSLVPSGLRSEVAAAIAEEFGAFVTEHPNNE